MKYLLTAVCVLSMLCMLCGCAQTAKITSFGRPVCGGFKPACEVAPCCQDMVAGKITLAECMQKPECKANGCHCCMNAIKDIDPAR